MELLQIYSRANEDRPKLEKKILFVRRIIWVNISIQEFTIKKPPRLLELFGNGVKINNECLNYFSFTRGKTEIFKNCNPVE